MVLVVANTWATTENGFRIRRLISANKGFILFHAFLRFNCKHEVTKNTRTLFTWQGKPKHSPKGERDLPIWREDAKITQTGICKQIGILDLSLPAASPLAPYHARPSTSPRAASFNAANFIFMPSVLGRYSCFGEGDLQGKQTKQVNIHLSSVSNRHHESTRGIRKWYMLEVECYARFITYCWGTDLTRSCVSRIFRGSPMSGEAIALITTAGWTGTSS